MRDDDSVKRYKSRRDMRLKKRGIRFDWDEAKHPRDENGRFSSGGTGKESYDVETGPVGKFDKKFNGEKDLAEIINKYYEESGETWAFGLRADKSGKKAGHVFRNSHNWYQDNPADWGVEGKFNKRKGMWDAGELGGVSTVGITTGYNEVTEGDIKKALNKMKNYLYDDMDTIYLVGTRRNAERGEDQGELLLEDGVCFGRFVR